MLIAVNGNGIMEAAELKAAAAGDEVIVEFMNSMIDSNAVTVYNGTNDDNFFMMNGRKYYQGIVFGNNDVKTPKMTFNVESVNKIGFTLSSVDGESIHDLTLYVYKDGSDKATETINLKKDELWKEIEINTSSYTTIKFEASGNYVKYGMGDFYINSNKSSKTHTVPTYASVSEFYNSGFEKSAVEFYDGSESNRYFLMKGRKYYQGIIFGNNSVQTPSIAFNVENVKEFGFTLARIDNSGYKDITIQVYKDGNFWYDITLGRDELWKNIKINTDKAKASVITLTSSSIFSRYGMADFYVDNYTSNVKYTVPSYNSVSDLYNASFECEGIEYKDGESDYTSIKMNGREYKQGFIFGSDSVVCPTMTFNVERINTIGFTLGRIDNTSQRDITITVYKNGNKYSEITMGKHDLWKNVTIDVSDAKTLKLSSDGFRKYGMANFYFDDKKPSTKYSSPSYETVEDFMSYNYESAVIEIFDGSTDYHCFQMNGKKYYQGIILGEDNYRTPAMKFNVENIDSLTFTVGRIDNSSEKDVNIEIYKDGKLWYTIEQSSSAIAKQYVIDTTDMKTIAFNMGGFRKVAMANIAINGDYKSFTNGDYPTKENPYKDSEKITNLNDVVNPPKPEIALGDVNLDGSVDSSDASAILVEYSASSTGGESTLSADQKIAADVNFDNTIDSSDASKVLQFYAYSSTGGSETDMNKWIETNK